MDTITLPPEDPRKGKPSASGIQRLYSCPGSLAMCATVPDRSTKDSTFGDNIHAFLAGKKKLEELTPEELDIAESCQAIEEKVVRQWRARYDIRESDVIEIVRDSQRLWFRIGDFDSKTDVFSGVADVTYRWNRRSLILDFKTLPGDHAESHENLQLRTLAVLEQHRAYGGLLSVDVAIIQPLVTHSPATTSYDTADLVLATDQILGIIQAAYQESAPRVVGDQCRFCRANNGTCPEARKEVGDMSQLTIREVGLTITDADLAALLQRCGAATKMIESIKAEAKYRAEQNPEAWRALGYELVQGNGKRSITNVGTVADRLAALGVAWPDITKACGMTLGNLEPLVRAATNTKGKGLKDKVAEIIEGCVETSKPAPTLERITP